MPGGGVQRARPSGFTAAALPPLPLFPPLPVELPPVPSKLPPVPSMGPPVPMGALPPLPYAGGGGDSAPAQPT